MIYRLRNLSWGVLLAASAIASAACLARAQWVPDGNRVGVRQLNPLPVSDGDGGAYVLTADWLTTNTTGDGVRLTHLDVTGRFVAGWPTNGLAIAQSPGTRGYEWRQDGCLQGDGSVTLAVQRDDIRRILVTRIRPDGSAVPGWDPPFLAAPGVSSQDLAQICRTPDDGNFVIWQAGGLSNWDVWMTRLTASGQTAPGWPAAGHEVGAGAGMQYATSPVLSDGGSGAWVAYYSSNSTGTEADAFVLRTDSLGNPAPGFPLYGRNITTQPGVQAQPWLCRDGADGVFVVWCDARACPGVADPALQDCYDIYVQHLTGTGEVAPGWPADGLPVCQWPGTQQQPKLLADGTGGAYVCWDRSGAQGQTAHVQHVLGNGQLAPGWPEGGKRAFGLDGYADLTWMTSDQAGGVFVTAEQFDFTGTYRVFVQHLTYGGQFDASWGAMGLPVVALLDGHDRVSPRIAPSLPGSAIITWNDVRSGSYEAYAARVSLDGVVATTVSLVSQDASAERVALAWQAGGDALAQATVERRAPGEAFRALANVFTDGTGTLRYEDRDITPGARYAYRLVWSEAGGTQTSPEVWIEVPTAARFALAGASPNPSPRSSLSIAYSLAESAPARLELYDAQGRVVARRDLAAREPGTHRERFAEATGLRAGLYWLRLTQGANSATARLVLVD